MGTVANSWLLGPLTPQQANLAKHRKHEGRKTDSITPPRARGTRYVRDRTKELVACHECKDGLLKPHGAHGLCKRHAAAFRRANLTGDCGVPGCGKVDTKLSLVNPPTCTRCYRRQRREAMPAQEKEARRAIDKQYQRDKRAKNPGESTRRERALKARDPEAHQRHLDIKAAKLKQKRAQETPEQREGRLAARRAKYAGHDQALHDAGERHRSRLDEMKRQLPQKTRVTGLSKYLRYVEPEVKVSKVDRPPVQTGLFDNALAARRVEHRPDKKYRARPRAA